MWITSIQSSLSGMNWSLSLLPHMCPHVSLFPFFLLQEKKTRLVSLTFFFFFFFFTINMKSYMFSTKTLSSSTEKGQFSDHWSTCFIILLHWHTFIIQAQFHNPLEDFLTFKQNHPLKGWGKAQVSPDCGTGRDWEGGRGWKAININK